MGASVPVDLHRYQSVVMHMADGERVPGPEARFMGGVTAGGWIGGGRRRGAQGRSRTG
jgi:hypothetical protein